MQAAVQHVEAIRGQILNYLKDLVRIPTVTPPGSHYDTHYMIRELGIPSLTYGPGTTGTAHTPDEYIVINDVTTTTQVLVQVALTLLS